jgi:hypothetical protein
MSGIGPLPICFDSMSLGKEYWKGRKMRIQESRRLGLEYLLICLAGCATDGQAQPGAAAPAAASAAADQAPRFWLPPVPSPGTRMTLRPLDAWIPGSEITLSGGERVPVEKWRAILITELGTGPTGWMSYCTATLVGPRTVLTAAHCIDGGADPPVLLRGDLMVGNRRIAFSCDMHPEYARYPQPPGGGFRSSHDYALCTLDTPVNTFAIRPESIDDDEALGDGQRLLLTGYGCTGIRPDPTSQQGFTYTPAETPDQRTLQMGIGNVHDAGIAWANETGVWTRSRAALGQPTICPGDSGGPVVSGSEPAGDTPERRVSAVNSGVALAYERGVPIFYSYLAPLATSSFRGFMQDHVRRHPGLIVCGVTHRPGQGGCRE